MADQPRIGYRLYKPTLTKIVTVKLQIGGSSIERHPVGNTYSVKVRANDDEFADNYKQQTSFKSGFQSLHWNEDLIFHNEAAHVNDMEFKFTLIRKVDNTDTMSKPKMVTLKNICESPTITFEWQTQIHAVYITKIDIDYEPDVRVRNDLQLCDEEDTFCRKRREVVLNKLKELGIKGVEDVQHVPNIAIIGSGGGMRAVVGMCGAMTALKDLGILDTAMYTAGVSGSSWYVSTLYANEFGFDPKKVNDSIQKRLETAPRTFTDLVMSFVGAFTKYNLQGKHNTLTDLFGGAVGDVLLGKDCHSKWSDQREKLKNGGVPLPLLAALHVHNQETAADFYEWIEFSPYEVFLPKYGTAIDMKDFGSEFKKGILKKRHPEQPVRFLQGVCGSAYAIILKLMNIGTDFPSSIQKVLDGITSCVQSFVEIGLGQVPNWFYGLPSINPNAVLESTEVKDTINTETETFMLADAGTAFNSPYPLILHPARNVDVILSFEFSQDIIDGSTTSLTELKKAENWAKNNGISFPKIDDDPKEENEEMRVFQTDDSPCIMHFMMKTNRFQEKYKQVAATEEERMFAQIDVKNYRTYKSRYSEREFNCLSKLMAFNVMRNGVRIRQCIERSIDARRKQKQ